MVPPRSDRISRVPPYSRTKRRITHTGLSPTMATLSRVFCLSSNCHWPGPLSLAATNGISVDVYSYGYLDVSVPRVRFLPLWIQDKIPLNDTWKDKALQKQHLKFSKHQRWVAPFGNSRIKAYSQLPATYRSVSRPSSPVHAKASTKCPFDT